MAGLVPAIHVFPSFKGVDARIRGHDDCEVSFQENFRE